MSMTSTPTSTSTSMSMSTKKGHSSVSSAVLIYWILPVLCIAILTRFKVDTGPPVHVQQSRPISIDFNTQDAGGAAAGGSAGGSAGAGGASKPTTTTPRKARDTDNRRLANKPSSYQDVVKSIQRRRLDISTTEGAATASHPSSKPTSQPSTSTSTSSTSTGAGTSTQSNSNQNNNNNQKTQSPPPRGASSDPARLELLQKISSYRTEYQQRNNDNNNNNNNDDNNDNTNPNNGNRSEDRLLIKAIHLGDALRMYDVQFHDGGTHQEEAITVYQHAIQVAQDKRRVLLEAGEETNRSLSGMVDVNDEIILDYSARSIDGILCALYTALGKTYFMANMFEHAVQSYTDALVVEPFYLDAMSSRGSAQIILGRYVEAGQDLMTVMEKDHVKRRFQEVFTGLARVLQAKKDAIPEGWEPMIRVVQDLVEILERQVDLQQQQQQQQQPPEGQQYAMVASSLARLYHVLFYYHDIETKDIDQAWHSLTQAYQYKMSVLPAWNAGFETQKIQATKQIFQRGFWPDLGNKNKNNASNQVVPIFIIGFVRSGSTLLERVLDAHPQIVGTGENSVFNGQLDHIRNAIVTASMSNDLVALGQVIDDQANGVVDEMRQRWEMVMASSEEDRLEEEEQEEEQQQQQHQHPPLRFVDKMLTNYYNVGFIHMLFPKALILHVAREPMDTIFSAYKHEFPSGALDYTSAFDSLTELYNAYRDLMEHWDKELPGRVTHVRYEDMVHDMPGVARSIIAATGLEWDDGVLEFHKKKQAVNTLSTTQVRKGVYKDSLQAWRKYETHLQPLVEMIGDRTVYDLKTTLPNYYQQRPDEPAVNNNNKNDEL